jgi:hypothetical protein
MRLPGSVNLPDAKKLAAGRVPALARVVQDNGTVYPIEMFEKAPLEEARLPEQTERAAIDKSKVQRVTDLNMLDEWNVPQRVRVIVAQGSDPQEPLTGDNTRSAWLWHALCEMARCNVPTEVMFSLITDPAWDVSACVLDKGRSADKDAQRQIARALQFAENPKLLEFNDRYCTVMYEGSFRVIERVSDPVSGMERLVKIRRDDFKAFWAGHEVVIAKTKDGDPVSGKLADWWLEHPKRRQYSGVVFAPERDVPAMLNLWTGFGDVTRQQPGSWRLLRRHIWKYTCNKDRDLFRYVIRWMAWKLQNPALPSEVAPVTLGLKGAGKSIIWENYARLFGRHAMTVTNQAHLTGNFNAHLIDKVFLFVDESLNPNDKQHDSILKTMLTGKTRVTEAKGVDAIMVANCLSIAIASNEDKVVVASKEERRYAVTRVSPDKVRDFEHFAAIQAELDDGGLAAMFQDLRVLKLGNWHPRRDLPQTGALQDQKWASLQDEERLVADILFEGALPFEHRAGAHVFVRTATLEKMAADRRLRFDPRTFSEGVAPQAGWERHKSNGVMGYFLPSLGESRDRWPVKPGRWPETDGLWAQRTDPGF